MRVDISVLYNVQSCEILPALSNRFSKNKSRWFHGIYTQISLFLLLPAKGIAKQYILSNIPILNTKSCCITVTGLRTFLPAMLLWRCMAAAPSRFVMSVSNSFFAALSPTLTLSLQPPQFQSYPPNNKIHVMTNFDIWKNLSSGFPFQFQKLLKLLCNILDFVSGCYEKWLWTYCKTGSG